jgi:acyl carrier protein
MNDISHRVRQIVATSFHVDESALSDATKAQDVDGWDSLAHATLILRLQRVFAVRLDPGKANAAQDLGRLTALIEQTIAKNA